MHPPRLIHQCRYNFLFSAFLLVFAHGSVSPLLYSCYYGLNYTENSAFQQSLKQVMLSLTGPPLATGFITTSAGQVPDRVYGIALCRGDVSPNDCRTCLGNGTGDMIQLCPYSTDVSIWYDHCFIRYSNDNFLGSPFGKIYFSCGENSESNPSLFGQQLVSLMKNLTSAAASEPSSKMFAAGEIDVTDSEKIYGMVQCRRDLSANDCLACLQALVYFVATRCSSTNGARVWHGSCSIRYDIQPFLLRSADTPPVSLSNRNLAGKRKPIIIIIPVVVLVAAALVSLCACLLILKRRREPQGQENPGTNGSLILDFDAVRVATNNFSDENKIGEGGFGPVYKGKLSSGEEVVVKRLSTESRQGIAEFKNEVELVANLRHRNLVRLLGYCAARHEKLLIYEFLPNSSLDKFIFDPVIGFSLDWPTRLKIIGGVARGLLYLHEDSPQRIIHRNLKARNVLLDGEMNPKIADFGIARNFRADQKQALASNIAGTLGYMPPEYAIEGQISVKLDVYSFGVLLLEIVSGRRNVPCQLAPGECSLLGDAWTLWRDHKALELLDPVLGETCRVHEVLRCIQIGLLCIQDHPAARPTMSSVLLMLNSNSETLPAPSPPTFFTSHTGGENSAMTDYSGFY